MRHACMLWTVSTVSTASLRRCTDLTALGLSTSHPSIRDRSLLVHYKDMFYSSCRYIVSDLYGKHGH